MSPTANVSPGLAPNSQEMSVPQEDTTPDHKRFVAPVGQTFSGQLHKRKIEATDATWPSKRKAFDHFFEEVSVENMARFLSDVSEPYCPPYLREGYYKKLSEYIEAFPKEMLADLCPLVVKQHVTDKFRSLYVDDRITEEAREKLLGVFTESMMLHARHLDPAINAGVNKTILPDTPVHMIWIDSLLPDDYLKTLAAVGKLLPGKGEDNHPVFDAPKREVILWKDRTLLSEADDRLMRRIPELPIMQGVKVKVLDINDAGLETVLKGREEQYLNAIQWTRDELKNYAMVSDIVRFALVSKGPEAIDCAEGKVTKREGSGSVYMDFDAIKGREIERYQQANKPMVWQDESIPLGFTVYKYTGNDFIVSTGARHPMALSTLRLQIENVNNPDSRKILQAARSRHQEDKTRQSTEGYADRVIKITGPICMLTAQGQLLGLEQPEDPANWDSINTLRHWFLSGRVNIGEGFAPSATAVYFKSSRSDNIWLGCKPQDFFAARWQNELESENSVTGTS